ncbi:MAG: diguanylate cyclase [Epulopiscium sp.]|nr:diguanylate cyclase [Candidatus Epulonipiscium sp.]
MRIAMSATGKTKDDLLDVRFGRCNYFLIYDTESEEIEVIENQGQVSGGGAGIVAAQQLINEKVDMLITGNLGPNAFAIMDKANIKVYQSESMPISSVLGKHDKGELKELKEAGPSHYGMGPRFRGGN